MVQGSCGITAIKTPETSVSGVFVFGENHPDSGAQTASQWNPAR
jgi:hypothetical protein